MWILFTYVHLVPTDVVRVISVPRPFPFFTALPLPCIILNANRRTSTGETWELGYHYTNTTLRRTNVDRQVSYLLAKNGSTDTIVLTYSDHFISNFNLPSPHLSPSTLFSNKMRKDVWLHLSWPSDREDHWTKLSCSASSLAHPAQARVH